jgi:hypothetical protein
MKVMILVLLIVLRDKNGCYLKNRFNNSTQ